MNRAILAFVCAWFFATFGAPRADPLEERLDLSAVGAIEPVFTWAESRCADNDVPDTPLRAVRLADGKVVAFSTNYVNRRFLGDSLSAIRRQCQIVFSGKESDDPKDYSDRVWISSTWSEDGVTIFALGHDEYQAHRHPGKCRFSTYMACWFNAIVLLRSDDAGRTFRRVGERPVASVPIRQDVDQGHNRGFFEPSNIVKRGSEYFALIRTGSEGEQKSGTCLFRTDDLTRAEAWRFYDGDAYSRNTDPYRDDARSANPCAPLPGLQGIVGSIAYILGEKTYVAVSNFSNGNDKTSGVYYYLSSDLIHWSPGRLLLKIPTIWSKNCTPQRYEYPSLIDVNSPSRNFDTIDKGAYLYITREKFDRCDGTMNRDLVRIKIRFSFH